MKKLLLFLSVSLISFVSFGQSVKREYDKFEDQMLISVDPTQSISLNKYISSYNAESEKRQDNTSYQLAFYVTDSYLTFTASDLILLFEDGTKIELEGEVDVAKSKGGMWRYSYFTYDYDVLEKLSTTKLNGIKIHIFKRNILKSQQDLLKKAALTLLSVK